MSKMKDIYTELTEGIKAIEARTKDLMSLGGRLQKGTADILDHLSRIEAVQLDSGKLVDRLIEMSMVVKGQAEEAVKHRSQANRDTAFETASNEDNDILKEDEWPPPGCDVMDVTG